MRLLLLGLVFLGNLGLASEGPDPRKVYIKKITWSGSGCADSTSVNPNLAFDARSFTLSFSEFSAEIGEGVPSGYNSSKCKIKIDLRFPQGWSYTLFDADYRGEVYLEEGVSADFSSKYYFQSNPSNNVVFSSHLNGEYDDFFHRRDSLGMSDLVWSPCGKDRALNVESEVKLRASDRESSGVFFIDSMDGVFTHKYGIQWSSCN